MDEATLPIPAPAPGTGIGVGIGTPLTMGVGAGADTGIMLVVGMAVGAMCNTVEVGGGAVAVVVSLCMTTSGVEAGNVVGGADAIVPCGNMDDGGPTTSAIADNQAIKNRKWKVKQKCRTLTSSTAHTC